MSAEEDSFSLKQTNASHPQLLHSHSKQSIAASEDYYSFSENGGDAHSRAASPQNKAEKKKQKQEQHHQQQPQQFITPPSQYQTPEDARRLQGSSSPSAVTKPSRGLTESPSIERQLRRKPLSSSTVSTDRTATSPTGADFKTSLMQEEEHQDEKMEPISPSTTPGIDDSPFIRFAIDQLTRDEEVRGSRAYADPKVPEEDYPVERLVPDEGLGYMAKQKEMQAGPPPKHPLHDTTPPRSSSSLAQYDVFVPYDPPVPTRQHPRLTFLPAVIRPLWLGFYVLLCKLMLTGLLFCAIWSKTHNGLWQYVRFGDSRYFVFEYLPIMLGMILVVWLFQIQVAVQRISPFMAMATNSTPARSQAAFLDLYPSQFLHPRLEYFRSAQPVLGICSVISWMFLFTIPLLASSFNARFSSVTGQWRWVAVQGVIWTVIALYILLIVSMVILAVHLFGSQTGLKWDPRSLADIIALLERANILSDYADSETFPTLRQFHQRLYNRTDRLGYWHTSRRPQDIFYGLGEEGGATRRYSIEHGRLREKPSDGLHSGHSSTSSLHIDAEGARQAPGASYLRTDFRSPEVRSRYTPWALTTTALLAFALLAIVLLVGFLAVAYVNRASTRGFLPQLPAAANADGFSPANFLYSFLPSLLGMLLLLLWQPFDFTHRRLAPFRALLSPDGATAQQSLLLDYHAGLPAAVTLRAASNGHWLIAITSLLSLFNVAIPILAGGAWWAQWYPATSTVRVTAHPPGLYTLSVFLVLHALGYVLLLVLPAGRAVSLPHRSMCLAEIISWLYMSPLLSDRAFSRVRSKAELVSRLMGAHHGNALGSKTSAATPGFWASVTSLVSRRRDEGAVMTTPNAAATAAAVAAATSAGASDHARPPTRHGLLEHPDRDAISPVFDSPTSREYLDPRSNRLSTVHEGIVPGQKTVRLVGPGETVDYRLSGSEHEGRRPHSQYLPPPQGQPQLLQERPLSERGEVRYAFGIYVGRDDREHIGIDRVRRGKREMLLFDDGRRGLGGRRGRFF